ncbi:hypothetical protein [Parvicella tangerina]|uniref:Outer membrane protein beta-barrel domain-containing protein n=1 Tax=Parvicella tangerina TaxID=2829795 RepID=A0A916NIE7_9FLAO|nr:hypothetical protein [Parvicella tangerina]CAG5083865.1 hypothetical protein CRYO30217_02314 [Parvicella tangerina]
MRPLFFILLLAPLFLLGQTKNIEIEGGYGVTSIDFDGIQLIVIGGNYTISPDKAPFYFYTGMNFSLNSANKAYYSKVRIPIGLNFNVGDKVQFILGGGLFQSYLFAQNFLTNSYLDDVYRIQLGVTGQIGVAYELPSKVNLVLSLQTNRDLTPIFVERKWSPGGAEYDQKKYSTDLFVKAGVRFPIAKK